MLKLAILALATIIVPCMVDAQAYSFVYIWGDPHIWSVNKGYETCSYSSPDWVASYISPRISVDSIFWDHQDGNQHPTVQKSFKIIFNRPGSSSASINNKRQEYYAMDPANPFLSRFVHGASNVPGWVRIYNFPVFNAVVFVDYSSPAVILGVRWPGYWSLYNLFILAPPSVLKRSGGLLKRGCPYNAVYPWQSYNPNPNIGRRKRQIDVCIEVARNMAKQLRGHDAFAFEVLSKICQVDAEFTKDVAEQMQTTFDALKQAVEIFEKEFPGDEALKIAEASQAEEEAEGRDEKE